MIKKLQYHSSKMAVSGLPFSWVMFILVHQTAFKTRFVEGFVQFGGNEFHPSRTTASKRLFSKPMKDIFTVI